MEREINLLEYLPDTMNGLEEIRGLMDTENQELQQLFRNAHQLQRDAFILDASIHGIKRYEKILGIVPYAGETLEERRIRVLNLWNRQLPYTMNHFLEVMDSAAGEFGYRIKEQFSDYRLEIQILEQSLPALHSIRGMIREMIPANLYLDYAGCFMGSLRPKIGYKSTLGMESLFYPRYNVPVLYLDGSWELDGKYQLNGYKMGENLDFYPACIHWRSETRTLFTVHGKQEFLAEAPQNTKLSVELMIGSKVDPEVNMGNELGAGSNIEENVSSQSKLTVEKDLWYLDGSFSMNGTKLLDAEIINYEI